jgi:hypothetical protein
MSRLILKYEIDLSTMSAQHAIPEGSFLLDVQMQRETPVMWWSVPADAVPAMDDLSEEAKAKRREWPLRTFLVAPTGGPGYTDDLHYVGSFQSGWFVGHILSHEPVPHETDWRRAQFDLGRTP